MRLLPNKPVQILVMITRTVFVVSLGFMFFGCFQNPKTGIGLSSRNLGNEWIYKFHYLNGGVSGSFTAKKEDSQLVYETNLQEGEVEFQLYDGANNLIATFDGRNVRDTLDGLFKMGEKYRVHALVSRAKGEFIVKME